MKRQLSRTHGALLALTLACVPTSALSGPGRAPAGKYWIWISPRQVRSLPNSGPAWDQMLADADLDLMTIQVADELDQSDSHMMAAGLVYRKLKEAGDPAAESYRSRVQAACLAAIDTEALALDALGPSRQVCAVVIAANLIDWSSPAEEAPFRSWVERVRFTVFPDGRSITSTHESRANNWGTHAGASRLACALYLKDFPEALRCTQVFAGWLGNRAFYSGFSYGETSWQYRENHPVGINPVGAVKDGQNVDGVLPDDQRRAGLFSDAWLVKTNYAYEALQGALAQAVMIGRVYPAVWGWGDRALLRAFRWLEDVNAQPITDPVNGSDDSWQGFLVNRIYGTSLPTPAHTNPGKAVGYTDWTTLNSQWP